MKNLDLLFTLLKRREEKPQNSSWEEMKNILTKWKCQDHFCNLTTLMTVSVMPPFVLLGIFTSMSGSTPPLKVFLISANGLQNDVLYRSRQWYRVCSGPYPVTGKNGVQPSLDILRLTFDLSPPSPLSCCISPTCSTPPTWQLEQFSNFESIHQ